MLYSLNKREKLSNKQDIQTLFSKGKAFFVAPIQLLVLATDKKELNNIKVGFAAPKKKYPKAVQRNRIKRLCKEAYRLQKDELQALFNPKQSWHIMVIYSGKELLPLNELQKALYKAFKKASHV